MDVEEDVPEAVFLLFGVSLIFLGMYLVYVLVSFCLTQAKSQEYPTPDQVFHDTYQESLQEHHLEKWTDVSPSVRNMVRRRVRPTYLYLPQE